MERDLYWGDNLDVLRLYIPDESVDLIYLDPPFNSNRSYNVLFKENGTTDSEAQIEAFTDTWRWTDQAEETYAFLVGDNRVPQRVSDLIQAMRSFIGSNDVMAYLVMMTVRLIELHRVLKPTGSIYLHCDPTASHYLKVVMDTIWGPKNFRNEVIWQRSTAKGHAFTRYPSAHDVLLYYSKSDEFTWHTPYVPHREELIKSHYSNVEPGTGRRYTLGDCLNPNPNRPNLTYEWNGHLRVWRWTREKMQQLHHEGRLAYTKSGMPRYKRYLDEMPGTAVTSVWTDIPPINSQAAERLGYPTQKPEALLERIINASTNAGDVVLDPFCGCGTAIAVAERLNRRWVGIDITHLAIATIVSRMESAFPGIEINRHGEPRDVPGAEALARLNRYDFQNWALALVAARPVAEDVNGKSKKGADRGIDGVIQFLGQDAKTPARCLVQVKSGHVTSATMRDLVGTVEREHAEVGLLITLEEPTGPMRTEALSAGYYHSEFMQRDYPRMQILTIKELLHGKEPQLPPRYSPYRLAQRQRREGQQHSLFDQERSASTS